MALPTDRLLDRDVLLKRVVDVNVLPSSLMSLLILFMNPVPEEGGCFNCGGVKENIFGVLPPPFAVELLEANRGDEGGGEKGGDFITSNW